MSRLERNHLTAQEIERLRFFESQSTIKTLEAAQLSKAATESRIQHPPSVQKESSVWRLDTKKPKKPTVSEPSIIPICNSAKV
jgi:hypothetical protein